MTCSKVQDTGNSNNRKAPELDYFVQIRKNQDYKPTDTQMKHVKEVLQLEIGEMKKAKKAAANMKAKGYSNEEISDIIEVDIKTIESWFSDTCFADGKAEC